MRRKNTTTDSLKEDIADALLKLMKTKDFDKITVSEIVDLAKVGRVTFYRTFTTKEEVLAYRLELLRSQWLDEQGEEKLEDVPAFFWFMFSIRDTLSIIYHAGLEHILLDTFYVSKRPANPTPTNSLIKRKRELANCFIAHGLFGLLGEWVHTNFKETPGEMARLVEDRFFQN